MACFIYRSIATLPFTDNSVRELAESAALFNESVSVTGYLYFDAQRGCFLQYVEGEADDLNLVYGKIESDPRHIIAGLSWDDQFSDRRFATWSMRQLRNSDAPFFKLERILEKQLELINRIESSAVDLTNTLWSGVDRLVEYRAQIDATAQQAGVLSEPARCRSREGRGRGAAPFPGRNS